MCAWAQLCIQTHIYAPTSHQPSLKTRHALALCSCGDVIAIDIHLWAYPTAYCCNGQPHQCYHDDIKHCLSMKNPCYECTIWLLFIVFVSILNEHQMSSWFRTFGRTKQCVHRFCFTFLDENDLFLLTFYRGLIMTRVLI